jgi:OmcA/MtrC family decaheme c-type cytochrome
MAFALGGCDGKDGRDGQDGQDGQDGIDGAEGPPGPGASTNPLESCGVCHDDGSFASAPDYHALAPIETVSNVAFAVNGADLDVTFDLAADGAPAMNYDSMQRGYQTDGAVRNDICGAPSRSDPCDPALLTLTNNGGGNYTVKVLGGAAAAATDSRYLFRVGAGSDRETRVYFYGDFPASPVGPPAVSAAACTACHGPEGIDVHGGYYAATDGAEPCLTCHGVDTTPSLAVVAHGYHNGIWVDDGEVVEVTYPTYMPNCSVCHSEAPELAAANAMPFSEGCFSCHGTMDNWDFTGPPDLTLHYSLTPTPETADCSSCHNPAGIAANKLDVTDSHDGWETERGGFIYGGVDTSIVEGDKFDWAITSMADDGVNLTFTWEASYDGIPVDPCNDTVGVGAPTFHLGDGGLRTYRSYAQGDDFIIGTSTSAPGQPGRANPDATNTACAGLVATTVIPVESVVAEKARIALGGKPLVESPDVAGLIVEARVPSPTYDWEIGTGVPMARRAIVDTTLCLDCHVGSLYQHGGDRVDNVDYCLVCHNAASNEQNVRTDTMGVDPADAYDGGVGETYEMKTMVHRIHSAGESANPYVIYRGRGVYGFAEDASLLPNWPGTGSQTVFGSTIANDGTPGSYVVNHNFHAPTYPRGLYDCAACHVDGSVDFQPDQRQAMASTREAGDPSDWANQDDDVLQGAATTACVTCHADGAAKGHAYQNSWSPQAFEEGRKTIIDAAN